MKLLRYHASSCLSRTSCFKMDGAIVFVWAALIIKLATSQCPTGDDWQLEASKEQCMLCVTTLSNWRQALDYCNARGGTLTGIHNDQQEAVVQACVATANGRVWIGLIRPDDGGVSGNDEAWLDGKAVTYGVTKISDDDTNGDQSCFVILDNNLLWNDLACSNTYAFVCSRRPDTCLLPDAPQRANINATSVTGPSGFAYSGNRITYTCAVGYTTDDDVTRTCLEGGAWDKPAPACEPVTCGVLTAPANGDVVVPAQRTYEAQACYSCEAGYGLSGARTRTCGASGTWDLTGPTCVAVATNGTSCTLSTTTVGLIAGGAVGGAILAGIAGALIASAVMRRVAVSPRGGLPPSGFVPPRGFPPPSYGPRRY